MMRCGLAIAFGLCVAICAAAQDSATAAQLMQRAEAQAHASDYGASLRTLQDALQAAEREQGADSLLAAEVWLRLSDMRFMRAQYADAQEAGRKALAIFEQTAGERSPKTARALAAIGHACSGATDYAKALPLLQRAVEIETSADPQDARFPVILTEYAYALLHSGDYGRARLTEERAVKLLEDAGRGNTAEAATALQVLSNILNESGDYTGAQRADEQALSVVEKIYGADSVPVADALVVMGTGAQQQHAYAQARARFERAVAIYRERLGPHDTRVGGCMDNLAQTLLALKDYAAARSTFEQALAIQTAALGPRSAWTGNVIQGLAKVAAATGDYEEALRLYRQNIDIWREQLGPAHPFTVTSLGQTAEVLARLGRRSEAIAAAVEAARLRRENIASSIRTMDERQALRYNSIRLTGLETALTLTGQATPDELRAIWDEMIRERGLILDEMAARHRALAHSADAAVRGAADELAGARSMLAGLVLQGRGRLSQADYEQHLEKARGRMHAVEEALALRSAPFRTDLARQRAGLNEVIGALPSGSALVAFLRYDRLNLSSPGADPVASYAVFIGRSDGQPRALSLGPAARIDSLVGAWRREIDRERDAQGRASARNEMLYRRAALALKRAVLNPVMAAVGNPRRIFIVPDGALQSVNFSALPAAGGRYLIETGPAIDLLTGERDLIVAPETSHARGLLAIGNPDFKAREAGQPAQTARVAFRGARSSCEDFNAMDFEPLPAAAAEARDIAALWKREGWPAELLTGRSATEEALREHASGRRVIHLATHAFFLAPECRHSAVIRENPLLRAGLALAGANHHQDTTADGDDGILTAEEAASLDLEDTDWVVLSGCDTSAGDLQAGEGVLGLRRAFQEAGARTIITSLWPVEDEDARVWMTALYRDRFAKGEATGVAVRAATRSALAARRSRKQSAHPYHWASFISVGDWR